MTVDKRYFESLMTAKKLSMRGLAQKMGKTHSQLSLMFTGQRRMQLEEAAQLADILGVPLARVAEAAGVGKVRYGGRRVDVIGSMNGKGVVDLNGSGIIERTITPSPDLPDETVAVQARTADTPNSWMDGWVFFCIKADKIEPDAIGRFCLAKIEAGDTVLATVRRGYRDNTFNLFGPYMKDSVALEWASPILVTRM